MATFGFKVYGCFGDVLYATPVLRYLSRCHNQKIDVETDMAEVFYNNPYVDNIYDTKLGHKMPDNVICYNVDGHNFGESQKQIRTMYTTDYWSTHLGFTLLPEDKTMEFYPSEDDRKLVDGNYVVINPSKTWDCRTWDSKNWESLSEQILKMGVKVVIVGKEITYGDDDRKTFLNVNTEGVVNLTNQLNLSQLWYVINNSKMVITMAAGILPFAGTTDANIIELGSATHPYYRTPYRNGSQNYKHKFISGSCKIHCQSDMKYNVMGDEKITRWNGFRSPGCYENKPTYECHPSVNAVFNGVLEFLMNK